MTQFSINNIDPFIIEPGLSILTLESAQLFWNSQQFFQDSTIQNMQYHNDKKKLDPLKTTIFIGDPGTNFNLDKQYTKLIAPLFQKHITPDLFQDIYQQDTQLKNIFNKIILDNDLPLKINTDFAIQALLKYINPTIDIAPHNKVYDIIVDIIDIAYKLADNRLFIFSNLTTYLSKNELIDFHFEAASKNVSILVLEKGVVKYDTNHQLKSYYIDYDFVDFR